MGIYGGQQRDLIIRKDNPLKYWEHRKAVRADQTILSYDGPPLRGQKWLGYGFTLNDRAAKRSKGAIKDIVRGMDAAGRAWFVKDPRISLVASAWMDVIDTRRAACVIVVRDPLEMSYRFLGYNERASAFSVLEWAGIWKSMPRGVGGMHIGQRTHHSRHAP